MTPITETRATLDDLYREDEKAELIGGRIVRIMPSGDAPTDAAGEIFVSLRAYVKAVGKGVAKADGIGYAVDELPSGRESFSPDASYYVGPRPANRLRFIKGAPTFAAEVRSENDYGEAAEEKIGAKRADYFAAGTLVVWDVDVRAEIITKYRAADPGQPATYRRGEIADAEPAAPGWRVAVDDILAK
jgi:Uma2 family endonuclease